MRDRYTVGNVVHIGGYVYIVALLGLVSPGAVSLVSPHNINQGCDCLEGKNPEMVEGRAPKARGYKLGGLG